VAQFEVRPAAAADARALAELFAAVAAEGTGIASEPPVDVEQRTVQFTASIIKHYRRASGELWDSIVMGLLL
jgi:hypothetical protein